MGLMHFDHRVRYPKAMLSVSKTSVPFNFQLTISRVYEEGDANILDEDEEETKREEGDAYGSEEEWKELKVEMVECEVPIKVWPGNTAFKATEVVFEV